MSRFLNIQTKCFFSKEHHYNKRVMASVPGVAVWVSTPKVLAKNQLMNNLRIVLPSNLAFSLVGALLAELAMKLSPQMLSHHLIKKIEIPEIRGRTFIAMKMSGRTADESNAKAKSLQT